MSDTLKKSKRKTAGGDYIVQGSILAAATMISKVIGVVYRIPLTNILGDEGNGYYGYAFQVYAFALMLSCLSLPTAVSKLVSARRAMNQQRNAFRAFIGSLVFAAVVAFIIALAIFLGAGIISEHMMKAPLSKYALRVLAPGLLVVAVMAVIRGYFQGLGTMVPTAVSQVVEQIINVATIQTRLGSNFRITGIDSVKEAHNLALLLRAGALIAPIQIVEERTIGPSLGQQNIDSGMQAMFYGVLFLAVFMLVYYKAFGFIANLALIFNLVLIVGVMSLIPGATMTLPGIAGIVLTLGMAVDANVLIYERIREELRAGRTVQQSINLGYERAFATIADSNITTFITALILFMVGTGSVKGFALVLMVGLASSMFTAVTACRAIVNIIWGGRPNLKKLSI